MVKVSLLTYGNLSLYLFDVSVKFLGWVFLIAVFMAAVLLFTMVFFVGSCYMDQIFLFKETYLSQIIMFSDLECDYMNPIDLCNKLNKVRRRRCTILHLRVSLTLEFQFVLPENLGHLLLTLLFLLGGQWTALLLNAPLVAFNVNK